MIFRASIASGKAQPWPLARGIGRTRNNSEDDTLPPSARKNFGTAPVLPLPGSQFLAGEAQ